MYLIYWNLSAYPPKLVFYKKKRKKHILERLYTGCPQKSGMADFQYIVSEKCIYLYH